MNEKWLIQTQAYIYGTRMVLKAETGPVFKEKI